MILEAKFISVADVVEAMAFHRTYRAGLGIEVTLEELKKGCGKRYARAVAQVCIELFQDVEFFFSKIPEAL